MASQTDREPTQVGYLMQKLAGAIRIATRDGTAANSESLSEEIDLGFLRTLRGIWGGWGPTKSWKLSAAVGWESCSRDTRGSIVALRQGSGSTTAANAAAEAFLARAQAAAAVSHEHVVQRTQLTVNNIPFIVMGILKASLDAG